MLEHHGPEGHQRADRGAQRGAGPAGTRGWPRPTRSSTPSATPSPTISGRRCAAMQGFSEALLEDYGERLDATGHDYAQRIVAGEPPDGHPDPGSARLQPAALRAEVQLRIRSSLETGGGRRRASPLEVRGRACRGARGLRVEGPLGRGARPTGPCWGRWSTNLLGQRAQVHAARRASGPRSGSAASRPRTGGVRLWVEDNGIGIRGRARRERIFRVVRAAAPGAGARPGTGIGLAIVQKGAARLGGQAGVESDPGVGSRFWIELAEAEATA